MSADALRLFDDVAPRRCTTTASDELVNDERRVCECTEQSVGVEFVVVDVALVTVDANASKILCST